MSLTKPTTHRGQHRPVPPAIRHLAAGSYAVDVAAVAEAVVRKSQGLVLPAPSLQGAAR